MEILEYDERYRDDWEEFVERSANGTIFHLQRFLDYHPEGRFQNRHILIRKKGKIVAVFPAAEELTPGGKVLVSHPGASYGGFVFQEDMGIRDCVTMVRHTLEFLKREGFSRLILTQPPIIYTTVLSDYVNFALWTEGARYLKRELSAVIEANADPLPSFKQEARTAVRKSLKLNVMVRESHDYRQFYTMLKRNLRMRHNVTPTHSLDELVLLARSFPTRIRLFCAYLGETPIGGIVAFVCNARVVLAFYISHREEYQSYRPVNLLIYELLRWTKTQGCNYLDLGTFTLRMEPDFGLAKFKENFRARGLFRDTFSLQL